jgi:hypothetical protein
VTVIVSNPVTPTPAPPICPGVVGPVVASGLPQNLPTVIQVNGRAYAFDAIAEPAAAGTLTRLGCAGPFEVDSSSTAPVSTAVFLRVINAQNGGATLFRYKAATIYAPSLVISGSAQAVTAGNQRYVISERWSPTLYSSLDIILYATDPTQAKPPTLYGRSVGNGAIGEYTLQPNANTTPAAGSPSSDAAKAAGLNSDLTIGTSRYLLTAIWKPAGATADGWITLYAPPAEGAPATLIGFDPRQPDLLIYRLAGG